MSTDLEGRLRDAGADARRVAGHTDVDAGLSRISRPRRPGRPGRTLTVAAAAATVTVAAVGMLVLVRPPVPVPEVAPYGSPAPPTASPDTPAAPPDTSAPATSDCSAANLPARPAPQPDLPPEVATLRAEIAAAAVACDYDALAAHIDPDQFSHSFGDDGDPIGYWRRAETAGEESEPMGSLRRVLDTPPGSWEMASGGTTRLWVWPRLALMDPNETSDRELADAIDEVVAAGLHPREMVEEMMYEFGGYIGYRVQIEVPDDNPTRPRWAVFIAGD